MAIGFTAELSHYPSGGRYAIQARIPTPAAHDSPALAAAAPAIAAHATPAVVAAAPAITEEWVCGHIGPPFIPITWRCYTDLLAGEECCVGPTGAKICCPIPCPTRCDGLCVDTLTDSKNCGACGVSCGAANPVCCAGKCTNDFTDPNNCGACGIVCGTGAICDDSSGLPSCVCPSPYPLFSNSNYFLWNSCEPVGGQNGGLGVSFVADSLALPTAYSCLSFRQTGNPNCPTPNCQNPVAIPGGLGTGCCPVTSGFTLQLNASPAPGASVDLMQFGILYGGPAGNQVVPQVQYWAGGDQVVCLGWGCSGQNWDSPLGSVASTLDQGTELNIQLNTSSGNVVSADFQVITPTAGSTPPVTVTIPQAYQLPIYAFQVDVVGPDNCSYAEFTTGSAVLNYTALSGQLCIAPYLPDCATGIGTAETSNLPYSTIGPCCGSTLSGQYVSP